MLLIFEILLTIEAFKKGWRALALLPMGGALVAGLVLGGLFPNAFSSEWGFLLGLPIDLTAVVALAWMCKNPKVATAAATNTRPAVEELSQAA